ncbi:MAG: hypothetical protein ACO1O6_11960 [Bacteroidota bacterium]
MSERIKYNFTSGKIELEILSKKIPWILSFILLSLFIIAFSIPFITIFLFADQITFRFLLTIIVCALVARYFLKQFLWNNFGREKYYISKNDLSFYNDFKWFKQNNLQMEFSNLEIKIDTDDLEEDTTSDDISNQKNLNGNLLFVLDDRQLRSSFQMPVNELISLSKKILTDLEK